MEEKNKSDFSFEELISWYKQRIFSTLQKSKKKPHLKKVVTVLERDLVSVLSSEVLKCVLESVDGERKNMRLVKKIADAFISKASMVIYESLKPVYDEFAGAKDLEEGLFQRVYLWVKSSVYADLKLSFRRI